jgi:hypothetical protein
MGELYEFDCPKCGYSAEVAGGPSVGECVRTATITCATCKKLRDAFVSHEPWNYQEPVTVAPKCPGERTRKHAPTLWEDPGPCPKCGTTMVRARMTVLWD